MNLPVRFRNGFNVEQPVHAALADGFGAVWVTNILARLLVRRTSGTALPIGRGL